MSQEHKFEIKEHKNTQGLLVKRPVGTVTEDCIQFVDVDIVPPAKDEVLVKVEYISMDPTHRIWMTDADGYMPPVKVGECMRAIASGVVVLSENDKFKPGDRISGILGLQTFATINPAATMASAIPPNVDYLLAMDVFGLSGLTAMVGLLDVGQPKKGETVVVSGAAGAVGSIVAQAAKNLGCNVVGIAGGNVKCEWLTKECGVTAIDYKAFNTSELLQAELKRVCPNGIDIFFDNVGGDILNTALTCLAMHARVVFCGAISQYNNNNNYGPSNYKYLLWRRARMEGFIFADPPYPVKFPEYIAQMGGWLAEGKLKIKPAHVENGLKNYVKVVNRLFDGTNSGKLVLKP